MIECILGNKQFHGTHYNIYLVSLEITIEEKYRLTFVLTMSFVNWYSFILAIFMLFLALYDRSIIRTPNTLAMLPFIFTESLKSLAIANGQLLVYIGGGFSLVGDTGCVVLGFIVLYGYPLALISLAVITYERYAVIVNSKRQSPEFADVAKKIIFGALFMACVCTVPLFLGLGYRK
ncbi:hypothetical protein ROZALSC1DRAFT_24388 [Rozella allomycis CSF55]|uniref:G-protein coupled receptors family 1 profile domain-containing protein n=1 Tax=Rozella allomycis (strain CSF55) TaxID=988480 RepID=A0A4P9YF84_ROZAC|nr:hypothetical protein ROZALSC1DRAFT_24388 [Rozella allomycis CSF55]